jgi:DNA-binding transcriptional LysR family regulator
LDRFKEMQVFVRIAERRSFTLASEDLFIPRATVTNLIKRLEIRLGVTLLKRTTRQVNLTHDGEIYYHRCVKLLAELEEVEHSFSNASPKGILRVNLQGTLAKHFVMPVLNEFLEQYPDITIHIAEDDRLIDLVKEGVDCVLRAGELQDSSLIAKRLALMSQVTVASPKYIQGYGKPKELDDLSQHWTVGYSLDVLSKPATLDFMVGKKQQSIELPTLATVAGAELYTSAALTGLGLIQVPKYRIVNELNKRQLIEVLPDCPPPSMPVSVVYPQNRHLPSRTRVFIQWLTKQFET